MLNILALAAFAFIFYLYRNRERFETVGVYAKDPICGMQVEKSHAPASTVHNGRRVYFCSDRCRDRFMLDADSYIGSPPRTGLRSATATVEAIDPVCGMAVDDESSPSLERNGVTWFFCGDSCRDAFQRDPDQYVQLVESSRS